MGILDDAIREHLELKRQHGADDDDLDRLEKEVFGPSTRPGDPEFDTSEGQPSAPASGAEPEAPEQPAAPIPDAGLPSTAPDEPPAPTPEPASGAGETVPAAEAPAEPASEPAPEPTEPASSGGGGFFDVEAAGNDEDWLASLEDVVEQPLIEPEEKATAPPPAPQREPHESTTSPIEDLTPAERARIEHADLGDTVDHPAVPAPETGEEDQAPPIPPPDTGEEDFIAPIPPETGEEDLAPGPPEPPESAIFEQGDEVDLGDLDLDLDEAEIEPASPRPVEPVTGEEDEYDADDAEEDELEDEDEDLLEETPDFLQDTPEGERLWFEQGSPKDFDFDDEDEDD